MYRDVAHISTDTQYEMHLDTFHSIIKVSNLREQAHCCWLVAKRYFFFAFVTAHVCGVMCEAQPRDSASTSFRD